MPRIILTGDILPADRQHTPGIGPGSQFSKTAGESWLSFFKDFSHDHDLIFGNLESPLVSEEIRIQENKTDFAGDSEFAIWLKKAGYDLVSVANNHILEFGEKGLKHTAKSLQEAEVQPVGLFDSETGSNLVVVERNIPPSIPPITGGKDTGLFIPPSMPPKLGGEFLEPQKNLGSVIKIGFAAFNEVHDIEIPETTARLSEQAVKQSIRELKKRGADIICLSLHWGNEYVHIPARWQIEFARKAIDLGADLIIGHHPHVIQPVEQYKNGWIFYSLGNFIFDMMWNRSVCTGMMAVLEFDKDGIKSCNRHAVQVQNDYMPVLVEGDPWFEKVLSDSTELMQNMLEKDADEYDRYYNKLVKRNRRNARIGMKVQLLRQWFSISKKGRNKILRGWF